MMTGKGITLLAAGITLTLLGLAFGSVPLVLLGTALALFLVATHLTSRFPAIQGERVIPVERTFEGDAMEVRLAVENPGKAPFLVEIADELSPRLRVASAESVFTVPVPGNGRAERSYELATPLRGHYSLLPTRYRVTDLFDNYARESRFGTTQYVTVFPKRSELRDMPSKSRYPLGLMGEHNVMQPGQGAEFFGLREYQPGDPMKAVNWKASARLSDALVVNQREKETVAEVTLLVDARLITGRGTVARNPLLLECRAASTLASLYLSRKDKVRVVAYGESLENLPSDTGERQLYKVLSLLAGLEPAGSLPAVEAVDRILATLRPKSPVLLVSSLEGDASAVEGASRLKALNIPLFVVTPSPLHCLTAETTPAEREAVEREREATLGKLRSYGARVIDYTPDTNLQEALMVVGKQ